MGPKVLFLPPAAPPCRVIFRKAGAALFVGRHLLRVSVVLAVLSLAQMTLPSPALGRRPAPRAVGYSVTLGDNTFRIWGARPTGIMPKGVSVSGDGQRVFVTNFGRQRSHNLDVFDARTLSHLRRVDFEGNTIESQPSRDGKTLYVTNMYGHLVEALDTSTWAHRWSVPVGRFPKMMALSEDGKYLYVSSWESGTVSRLDAATGRVLVTSRRLGRHPRGVSVHPQGGALYVAITGGKHVVELDARTLTETRRIPTCSLPRHTQITRDGSRLYVSCIGGSMLQVIDTQARRVVRAVYVGHGPRTLALSTDERFVYIAAYAGHGLTIVDTVTWKKRLVALDIVKGSGVAVRPDDRFIYVTGWCTKDIWVVERIWPKGSPGPLGKAILQRTRPKRDPATARTLDCPRASRDPG